MIEFFKQWVSSHKKEDPQLKGLKQALKSGLDIFEKMSVVQVSNHLVARFDVGDSFWLQKPQKNAITHLRHHIHTQDSVNAIIKIAEQLLASEDPALQYCIASQLASPLNLKRSTLPVHQNLDEMRVFANSKAGHQLIRQAKEVLKRMTVTGPSLKKP